MDGIILWSVWLFVAAGALMCSYLTVKGFAVIRIGWLNLARLKELEQGKEAPADSLERQALERLIQHCRVLRGKWILDESDLNLGKNTQALVEMLAAVFYPASPFPVQEARIEKLLQAFLEMKERILGITRLKGMRTLTRFRLRHVLFLSRAWKKKEELQDSALGRAASRYRVIPFLKWINFLVRWADLTFWTFRMLAFILQNLVLKILLVRWYLTVGELAIQVYRDRESESEIEAEGLLDELEAIPEEEVGTGLPEGVRGIADTSRKQILFNVGTLEWTQVKTVYLCLVEDIARFYHPESERPLYEVTLFDLMMGFARFAEWIHAIQTKPVLNKLLDLRVSHLLRVKDSAQFLRGTEIWSWLQKYQLHRAVKWSRLLYKIVLKRHPGILFKEFAFALAKEGGKRWVYLYLHDKIAEEAALTYQSGSPS